MEAGTSGYDELADLTRHVWLDYCQMAAFEQDPVIVSSGDGIRFRTIDGREFVDALSGAVVNGLGYTNQRVADAMKAQIDSLMFWPTLHSTTEPAIRLGARLAELLPGDLSRAFFTNSGSEATECALKMARQYHLNTGRPQKFKIVSRYGAFHGLTRGALAATGLPERNPFSPHPPGFLHALPPFCFHCPFGQPGPDTCGLECAGHIERIISMEGPETVSALIVDPVMGGRNVVVPPRRYYQELRKICNKYNIVLIFDEVMTGFGRLGEWFAADYYGVVPDIICLAKGIASGYAPLAATVATTPIADAFLGETDVGQDRRFLHGTTYGGHPLSCATGLAVIDELVRLDAVTNARVQGARLGEGLSALARDYPCITDVRGAGILWGVEFTRSGASQSQEPFAPAVVDQAFKHEGLLIRASRQVIQIAPPLVTTPTEIDDILSRLERAIRLVVTSHAGVTRK